MPRDPLDLLRAAAHLRDNDDIAPASYGTLTPVEPPLPTSSGAATSASSADSGYVPVESAEIVRHAWDFAAEVRTSVTYDDNLFISHDNPQSDVEFAIVPMVAFGWGDVQAAVHQEAPFPHRFAESIDLEDERNLILVRYALTAVIFADHSSENSLDHDAAAIVRWHFPRLDINFVSRYLTLSNADVDLGTRVDRIFVESVLRANYDISDKFSVEAAFLNETHDYATGRSSVMWKGESFFDYQLRPKTRLGIGISLGRLEYDRGDNQNFERALVRALYNLTDKISFSARTGVEFRQFDSGKDTLNPIFGLGATYSPFDSTSISLEASRDINSTAQITRSNVTRATFAINVRQRFHHFIYLMLSAGYTNADYETLPGVIAAERTDNVFYIYPSIGFDITQHASLQIGYRYWRDESSLPEFSFTDNQTRVQLNLSY